jgi:hypothetical protein
MEYKLYTLVDITHTGQHRPAPGREAAHWQEQNFNTVIHTLGLRSNITWVYSPEVFEVGGRAIGFDTDEIIRVWRFDWATDRDLNYEHEGDQVGLLKEDFVMVPYINGLNEAMEQRYAVFNPAMPGNNISFFKK